MIVDGFQAYLLIGLAWALALGVLAWLALRVSDPSSVVLGPDGRGQET